MHDRCAFRFQWTGNAEVQREALEPVLSALEDPRLAGGASREFNAARDKLRVGTPEARKQAVAEASDSVESALKVLLQEHGESVPPTENLNSLLAGFLRERSPPAGRLRRAALGWVRSAGPRGRGPPGRARAAS